MPNPLSSAQLRAGLLRCACSAEDMLPPVLALASLPLRLAAWPCCWAQWLPAHLRMPQTPCPRREPASGAFGVRAKSRWAQGYVPPPGNRHLKSPLGAASSPTTQRQAKSLLPAVLSSVDSYPVECQWGQKVHLLWKVELAMTSWTSERKPKLFALALRTMSLMTASSLNSSPWPVA